jgi:hypothetical protein
MATDTTHEERERRAGKNQALFREVNESVNEHQPNALSMALVCECANENCTERIELTPEEYGSVRDNPTRFAVAPGEEHVYRDFEIVVELHERFWVVEKTGEAGDEAAEQHDPG